MDRSSHEMAKLGALIRGGGGGKGKENDFGNKAV